MNFHNGPTPEQRESRVLSLILHWIQWSWKLEQRPARKQLISGSSTRLERQYRCRREQEWYKTDLPPRARPEVQLVQDGSRLSTHGTLYPSSWHSDSSWKQPSSTSASRTGFSVLAGRNAHLVYPVGQKTRSVCGTRRTGLSPDVREHLDRVCAGNLQLKVGSTS